MYKSHKLECFRLTLQEYATNVLQHAARHVSSLDIEALLLTIMAQGQLFLSTAYKTAITVDSTDVVEIWLQTEAGPGAGNSRDAGGKGEVGGGGSQPGSKAGGCAAGEVQAL